jgi:hypothetical protein
MEDSPSNTVAGMSAGHGSLFVGDGRASGRERLLDVLGTAEESTAVLFVTTTDSASGLDGLRRRGLGPGAIGVVDASGETIELPTVAQSVRVAGPGSLSALGVAVSDRQERLAHRYDRVAVGLDSVTDLVEASSVPATFRFLHVLRGRIRVGDAVLLATVDGGAHEDESVRTLAELFDERIEVVED